MSDMVSQFRPRDGVTYMLVGDKHGPMLVVSLLTLREHYQGPVCLIVGDDASAVVGGWILCSRAFGSNVTLCSWKAPVGGGKALQHANKANLLDLTPFDRTVFLDADTTVHGPINELLPRDGTEEVRLTRFSDWVSNGKRISKRIEQYRELLPRHVALQTANPYPAINTGTFGFSKLSTRYFDELKRVCKAKVVFMADELAAQLIFVDYPHVVMDDRWNHSCLYGTHIGKDETDVRIWHWHGFKHVRADAGKRVWCPTFRVAWNNNVAGIREWAPAGDRQLRKWMAVEGMKG